MASRFDDGKAARTVERLLVSLKACLNWAVKTRRILYNPIACVERIHGEGRHVRRALTEEEISRLLAAAVDGPKRRGIRGRYHNRPRKDGTYKPLDIPARLLRCFNEDILAAKIPKKNSSGRVIDLHFLRHTFGTRLGRTPGVDPKSVQTFMRHSDPRMTFGVYVHSDKERLKTVAALLPAIQIADPATPVSRAKLA